MTFCWAKSIGGCGLGRSDEHLISLGILNLFPDLTVRGYKWCRDTPKHIGPNLKANHLCKRHNNALEPTDRAAIAFFRGIRDVFDDTVPSPLPSILVSGPDLERWFLKSSINTVLTESSPVPWLQSSGAGDVVPEQLVRQAFGLTPIPSPLGLYFRGSRSSTLDLPRALDLTVLHDAKDAVVGFEWQFHGLPFLSWLDTNSPPYEPGPILHPHSLTVAGSRSRTISLTW